MTANTEAEGEPEVAETGGTTGGAATGGTTAGGVGCVAEHLDAEEVDETGGVGVLVVAGTTAATTLFCPGVDETGGVDVLVAADTTGGAATTLFCPGVTIWPVAVGKAPV